LAAARSAAGVSTQLDPELTCQQAGVGPKRERSSGWLDGPDEGVGDHAVERAHCRLAVEVSRNQGRIELLGQGQQVGPSEDLGRLDRHIRKARRLELGVQIVGDKGARDAARPEADQTREVSRQRSSENEVGYREAAAGQENSSPTL
jgi:hypothetical protein